MNEEDKTQIGLSENAHTLLQSLKDDGFIQQLQDGYRLGIGLAVARGKVAQASSGFRTIFAVSTIDPDGALKTVLTELYPEERSRPYAFAERLAEYGVRELGEAHKAGTLNIGDLLDEAARG